MAGDDASSALYSFSSFFTSMLPSARADEPKEQDDAPAAVAVPTADSKGEDKDAGSADSEDSSDSKDSKDDAETEDGGEEEAPAEEEEEEEEPEDEYPAIREKCADSKECVNIKHHFEHCSERVNAGKGHHNEDCVEELFHLMHCVDTCAAPKLFAKLR